MFAAVHPFFHPQPETANWLAGGGGGDGDGGVGAAAAAGGWIDWD